MVGLMVKCSFNLPAEVVEAIQGLARKRGSTMTEVIRQAIGAEAYLDGEVRAGSKVLVEVRGHIREVVFPWMQPLSR